MQSARLKSLEALVNEAAQKLRRLSDSHRKLLAEADGLRAENERLQKQLKKLSGLGAKHEKIKNRLERLLQKLDKVTS